MLVYEVPFTCAERHEVLGAIKWFTVVYEVYCYIETSSLGAINLGMSQRKPHEARSSLPAFLVFIKVIKQLFHN